MADFLDEMLPPAGNEPDPEVPTPAPIVEEPVEAAAPEPEPTQPEVTPAETPKPEPVMVPLAALEAERDRRRAFEDQVRSYQSAQQQPAAPRPDPYDDPEGYDRAIDQRMQQALFAERFSTSEYLAKEKYGEEKVNAAGEWATEQANSNPAFAAEFASQRFPLMWVVQQHQRNAMLSEIGDRSVEDFVREYVQKNPGLVPQSAPAVAATPVVAAPQAPKPVTPPRSIASDAAAPNTGRDASPMADLDAIFNRR